jgi:hypothetical protein
MRTRDAGRRRGLGVFVGVSLGSLACGAVAPAVRLECPVGQTSLDETCVSQSIADYVACIRATGATVASNTNKSLSAAAGLAGVTASTQADVMDKLERRYSSVSDANALEIIHNCYEKTAVVAQPVAAPASRSEASTAPAPVEEHASPAPLHVTRWSTQKTLAVVSGGVGVAGAVFGTAFAFEARSKNSDSEQQCNPLNVTQCNAAGVSLRNDARTDANIATVGAAVALVGLGGGLALWLTAPNGKTENPSGPRVTRVVAGPSGAVIVGEW